MFLEFSGSDVLSGFSGMIACNGRINPTRQTYCTFMVILRRSDLLRTFLLLCSFGREPFVIDLQSFSKGQFSRDQRALLYSILGIDLLGAKSESRALEDTRNVELGQTWKKADR